MNKYNIEFSKEARQDLIDINSYIKYNLQEPNIAEKLIKKIKEQIFKLKDSPTIYAIIDDDFIRKLNIRKIIVENYIIFYKIDDINKMVQIVRIMYGKRNWINML